MVFPELGIDLDVEQAGLAVEHIRNGGEGMGANVGPDMLEWPGALGHQERPVREGRHRPRHLERACDPDRGEIVFGEYQARPCVRPRGPGLGVRTAGRAHGQKLSRGDLQ